MRDSPFHKGSGAAAAPASKKAPAPKKAVAPKKAAAPKKAKAASSEEEVRSETRAAVYDSCRLWQSERCIAEPVFLRLEIPEW